MSDPDDRRARDVFRVETATDSGPTRWLELAFAAVVCAVSESPMYPTTRLRVVDVETGEELFEHRHQTPQAVAEDATYICGLLETTVAEFREAYGIHR